MAEDISIKREIVVEADAQMLEKLRKEGHARGFTVYCDEAERTRRRQFGSVAACLFCVVLGFLTANPNFPVRGNVKSAHRQGKSVCHGAIQKRGLGAARNRPSGGSRLRNPH